MNPQRHRCGIPPLLTVVVGAMLSAAIGWLIGNIAILVAVGYLEVNSRFAYVFFWPLALTLFGILLQEGFEARVETGHEGVPVLFGWRIWFFTLAEGDHWLLPWSIMDLIEVNVQAQTNSSDDNKPIKVSGQSSDGVLMSADIVIKYWVVHPALSLSVGQPIPLLKATVEEAARIAFSHYTAEELRQDGTRKEVADKIKERLDLYDDSLGIEIGQVLQPEILPPVSITTAHERKLEEQLQSDAQEIEIQRLRKRARPLVDEDGLAPELAYEIVQTESSKLQGTRNVNRYEGLKPFAEVLAQGLVAAAAILKGNK